MRFFVVATLSLFWCVLPAGATEILVYYGNEPTQTPGEEQNLRQLMRWLIDSKKPLHRRLAELLAEDRKLFPETVERDVLQLQTRLTEDLAWREQGVIVFTNKLARQGSALVHHPGGLGLKPIAFSPEPTTDVILEAQPLSDAKTFHRAMRLIASTFPDANARFAAIFKTHATKELAIAPFACVHAVEAQRQEILARLPLDDRVAPEFATVGIRREEFLVALERAGLSWALLFLDAVYQAPEFSGRVRVSRSEVSKYATIPYAALSPSSEAGGLVGSLERTIQIQERAARERGLTDGATSGIRYFLLTPLLFGIGLLFWLIRRNR